MVNDIDRDEVVENTEIPTNFDDVLALDAIGNEELDTKEFDKRLREDFSIQITADRKLTQEVADLIKLNYGNPCNDDKYMRIAPYGRQQYFGCYVPEEYIVTSAGVWWMQQKRVGNGNDIIDVPVKVCGARVMPTGQFTSPEGTHIVELSFVNDKLEVETLRVPLNATQGVKEWKEHIRKNNYSSLVVTDNELKNVIDFIYAARQANLHDGGTAYKTGEAFTTTGWADKSCTKFVIGSKVCIDAYNTHNKMLMEDAVFIDTRNIEFEDKLKPHGTMKGWVDAISPILRNPILRFKMYYDAATIVLAYLGVSNSAFGLVGDTSIGKTFSLQCSTSMFGNPNAKGEGLIISGDISLTALNAMLTTLVDIPVPVDEITIMKEEVKKALTYAIGNGSESLRGTKEGDLRSHKKIRTNVTLTGEVDITSELANNGANVRAFSCKQKPLPDMDPDKIDKIRNGILVNYGHVLPRLVAKFFENRDKVQGWYNFALKRLRETTGDNLAKRKAEYFAAAEVGGALLELVFKENGIQQMKTQDIIDEMWSDFVLGTPDTPLAIKALRVVYDWAISHPANFLRGDQLPAEKNQAPIFGFFSYPPHIHDGEYELIDFVPSELRKFLKDRGYDNPSQIVGWWRDHDISQGRTSKKTKNGVELTAKAYHVYAYGEGKTQKDMYRVRMSKIKEYVETGEEIEIEADENPTPKNVTNYSAQHERDLDDYKFAFGSN